MSPLEGHIYLKLKCQVDSSVEEKGFLVRYSLQIPSLEITGPVKCSHFNFTHTFVVIVKLKTGLISHPHPEPGLKTFLVYKISLPKLKQPLRHLCIFFILNTVHLFV